MKKKNDFSYMIWIKFVPFILIPIITILLASGFIMKLFEANITEQHNLTTQNAIEAIENRFSSMGKMSYQIISSDPIKELMNLKKSTTPEYHYKIKKSSDSFEKVKRMYGFDNILLYFCENDVAISSNSLCTDSKKYYEKILKFNDLDYDGFMKYMEDYDPGKMGAFQGSIRLGRDQYNGIIFTYKYKAPNSESADTFLFLTVKNDYIDGLFSSLTQKQSKIFITNSNEEILYQNANLKDSGTEENPKNFKPADYIITETKSYLGLTYHCYTPKNLVLSEVMVLNVVLIVLSMVVVLFTLLLFTFMCLKNGKIVNHIARSSGITVWKKNQSVFDVLNDAMEVMINNNEILSDSMDKSMKTLQKEFFLRLFIYGFNFASDVTFYSQNANVNLEKSRYYVYLLSAYYKKEEINADEVMKLKDLNILISEDLETCIGDRGHVIRNGCEELIIVLDSAVCHSSMGLIKEIENIYKAKTAENDIAFNACSSGAPSSIEDLPQTYLGCAAAIYSRYTKNDFKDSEALLVWSKAVQKQPLPFVISDSQKQKLLLASENGNVQEACTILKDLFHRAIAQGALDVNAKNIFITTCKSVLVKASFDKSYDFGKLFACMNALNLSPVMLKLLLHSFGEISRNNLLQNKQINKNDELHRKLVAYIDANLSKPELSLKTMSSDFGFAPTYFSALFKEAVGENLSTYIDQKRMCLAKELLLKKTLRVDDIGKKCGYSSVNSFRRAFKHYYGISPSQASDE